MHGTNVSRHYGTKPNFNNNLENLIGRTGILSLEIQTENLEAGKYFLYLFAEDLSSHSKSMTTTSFSVSD